MQQPFILRAHRRAFTDRIAGELVSPVVMDVWLCVSHDPPSQGGAKHLSFSDTPHTHPNLSGQRQMSAARVGSRPGLFALRFPPGNRR
jgi:hypothetical protein